MPGRSLPAPPGNKLALAHGFYSTISLAPDVAEVEDLAAALREIAPVVILSDTFEEFAKPLLRQLEWPTLLCHRLEVVNDRIVNYRLRIPEQKRQAVAAFRAMNYHVIAAGDSFNDTAMLAEANVGIFFRAPVAIQEQFLRFKAVETYGDLLAAIRTNL